MTSAEIPSTGSDNASKHETAISLIDRSLSYRGYSIDDLVENSNFLETAFLLVKGDLPSQEQLADMLAVLSESSVLDEDMLAWIERLPFNIPSVDVMRTGISLLAASDAYEEELSANDVWETLQRLLAQLPLILIARHRIAKGLEAREYRDDLNYTGNLLWGLTDREPTQAAERALDAFMVLSAEHELTPSTYAVRVIASTRSDFLSATIAGLCAIKGIWHGGPGQQAIDILEAVEIPEAAKTIVDAVLKQYERMPGFWHRVYRTSDPRSELLRPFCKEMAAETGMLQMESVASAIESEVWNIQQILPSFDWAATRLLHYLGLDSDLFISLFAISRTVGWAAHFIEQQDIPQPIRRRADYVGQSLRPFTSLNERG